MELEAAVELSIGEEEQPKRARVKGPQPLRYPFGVALNTGPTPANPFLLAVRNRTPATGRFWEITDIGTYTTDGHTQVTTTLGVNQIALGASGVATYNNNSFGVFQTITGGTVSAIAINGTATGLTSGQFFVPAGGTVTVTYTVAPTLFFTTSGATVISDMYAGASAGMDSPGDLQAFIVSSNIPTTAPLIGDKKAWCGPGDYIYAWVYNAPANVNLVLAGEILDWRIEDRTEVEY